MRSISRLVFAICVTFVSVTQQQQHPLQTTSSFLAQSIFGRHEELSTEVIVSQNPHIYEGFNDATPFAGIVSFAHLNSSTACFDAGAGDGLFDIAVVGAPFDLGVSYRPGARFGPAGARMGSRRLAPAMGYSMDHLVNPFTDWAAVVDCGDIPSNPFDKLLAIRELEHGWDALAARTPATPTNGSIPRIVSLGGDHTISLPAIRSLAKSWDVPVTVLHFDSHLDSWDPKQLGGGLTKYAEVNHGTMFHLLHEEGLLHPSHNMHLGSRTMLFDRHYDLDNDARCGFSYVLARQIDRVGVQGVVQAIVDKVQNDYVYLSIDVDVMDPAFAPATGTIEPGGWTSRELLEILTGLSHANISIIGADVVELSPVYDNQAETTAIAASQIVYEILQWMVRVPVFPPRRETERTSM